MDLSLLSTAFDNVIGLVKQGLASAEGVIDVPVALKDALIAEIAEPFPLTLPHAESVIAQALVKDAVNVFPDATIRAGAVAILSAVPSA